MRIGAFMLFAGLVGFSATESFGQTSRNCIVQPQFERALYDKAYTTKPMIDRPDFEKPTIEKPDFTKSDRAKSVVERPDFEKPRYLDCLPDSTRRSESTLWPGFYPSKPVNAVNAKAAAPAAPTTPVPVAKVEAAPVAATPTTSLGFKPATVRGGFFYEPPARECCGSSSAK